MREGLKAVGSQPAGVDVDRTFVSALPIGFLTRPLAFESTRDQSPAMPPTATPVILPAASKPNRRLVASPRGNTNFRT